MGVRGEGGGGDLRAEVDVDRARAAVSARAGHRVLGARDGELDVVGSAHARHEDHVGAKVEGLRGGGWRGGVAGQRGT